MGFAAIVLALLAFAQTAWAQAEYRVYAEHPRLLLGEQRLDRLRKDVERDTVPWRNFYALIGGEAALPEQPLANALLYQAADDEQAGRAAAEWALAQARGPGFASGQGLRQGAFVFDWTYPLLSAEERASVAAALGSGVEQVTALSGLDPIGVRGAVLAAISAAGDWSDSETHLGDLLERRWRREILPALRGGVPNDHAAELLAVLEICHAVRDNLERDLWTDALDFFKPLPFVRMLSYYPPPLGTPRGLFHRPATASTVELDVERESTLGRIAELLLVAYENRWDEYQFLQGWLRNDAYTMNSPLGAVYEFLLLNPYLPGLGYSAAPLMVHDRARGRLFARDDWGDGDRWVGYLDGELQVYADGELDLIRPEDGQAPLLVGEIAVIQARMPMEFRLKSPAGKAVYIVGLGEGQAYNVRVGRSRMRRFEAGRGGIIVLENDADEKKPWLRFNKRIKIGLQLAPSSGPSLLGKD